MGEPDTPPGREPGENSPDELREVPPSLHEDYDPAQARAAAERRRLERAQQVAREGQQRAEEVERVRQLINERAQSAQQLETSPEQARQAAERTSVNIKRLESLNRAQHALREGLQATDISERLQTLTQRLSYFETELQKTQHELGTTEDEQHRVDLQEIERETTAVIVTQRNALEALQQEFEAWQSELAAVANPILEALGRAGETVEHPEQLHPLFEQLGERILTEGDLAERSSQLLGRLNTIEASLFELLEKPPIQKELYGLYRRERNIRAELAKLVASLVSKALSSDQDFAVTGVAHVQTYESKLQQEQWDAGVRSPEYIEAWGAFRKALETLPPAAELVEQLTDDFIDGLAERYGLNDEEISAEMRLKNLEEIIRFVQQVFWRPGNYDRAIRDAASAVQHPEVGGAFLQRYHSQDHREQLRARVEVDATAFAYLMFHGDSGYPDPQRAWHMFEFEERIAHRRSTLPQTSERQIAMRERSNDFIRERFRPYGVMLERIKAAQDAESTTLRDAGIPRANNMESRFFGSHFRRALEYATASNRPQEYGWVPSWGIGKPMLPFDLDQPNEKLTPEQHEEKEELVAAYAETYQRFGQEIPRYIGQLQERARELVAEIEPILNDLESQKERLLQEANLADQSEEAIKKMFRPWDKLPVDFETINWQVKRLRELREQLEKTGLFSFNQRRDLNKEIRDFEDAIRSSVTQLELVRRELRDHEPVVGQFPGNDASYEQLKDWYHSLDDKGRAAKLIAERLRIQAYRQLNEVTNAISETKPRLDKAKESVWYTSPASPEKK